MSCFRYNLIHFLLTAIVLLVVWITDISIVNAQKLEHIAEEMRISLKDDIIEQWYPRTVDSLFGGFLSNYTCDWQQSFEQDKMLVTQARHVWTASEAAEFLHDSLYLKFAEHGYRFLRDKMWDKKYGGFFMLLNREGMNVGYSYGDTKTAYGNAFALYGLSGYFKVSGDTAVLNLARKTFYWLEKHSHDSINGGYFDRLMRNGSDYYYHTSELSGMEREQATWKDYNSSIHLLEAFTELYKVWPDTLVRVRIIEMLTLIRETLIDETGFLKLYFTPEWEHISYADSTEEVRNMNLYYDHVSFGHDVETAYLMLEASHTINNEYDMKTLLTAKRMVDHALANGWDNEKGGFYEMGYYYKNVDSISLLNDSKIWWCQAEGLNSLLMMAILFDEADYLQKFQKQWQYINTYLIDHVHGEWYFEGMDSCPETVTKPKTSMWKVNYHNSRALMNCICMLENKPL